MSPPNSPGPHTRPLQRSAVGQCDLAQLLERLREAEARLETVREVLPPGLRAHVRAGVLDDTGWNFWSPTAPWRQSYASAAGHRTGTGGAGLEATSVRVKVQSDRGRPSGDSA